MSEPLLHGYWRSGAAWRVRIALNLKGLAYAGRIHDLRTGEHKAETFRTLNPQAMLPALEADGAVLTQSPAILEYLEEAHPEPPLLPRDPIARAKVRAMAAIVCCDIHPLNNLRVLTSLRQDLAASEDQVSAWIARWIGSGFEALEVLVARHGRGWCFGDRPTLADCCLIPQVYSARRFGVDLSPYPHLAAIDAKASEHRAFRDAHADSQPDAS